jgi:hypothetical protein
MPRRTTIENATMIIAWPRSEDARERVVNLIGSA